MKRLLLVAISIIILTACTAESISDKNEMVSPGKIITVCANRNNNTVCDFSGKDAIQQAVDSAQSGSTIVIKSGVYRPESYRDTPFQHLLIRGFTLIENKNLSFIGQGNVILDGSLGAACAFVTKNSHVSFKNIHLNDFRWGIEEDDTYDGHGIFAIGGHVMIDTVSMRKIQKMGLTVRDAARVDVTGLNIMNSHLGVWANEQSIVNIQNSLFHGSESSGLAAYDKSKVTVKNSVFEANQDDGIYASDDALITIIDTVAVSNKPHGVSADKNSRIHIDRSYVSGNEKDFSDTGNGAKLRIGEHMLASDPRP